MNFDCAYKNIDYYHSKFYSVEDCMCDTSLIVPDTKSDIVKILSVTATPSVSDTKAENGRITISGQVKFTILYIGEDAKICSVNTVAPFSHLLSVNMGENAIPFASITAFNAEHTLVNSRKIKVSSLIKLCVTVYEAQRKNVLTSASGAQIKFRDATFYSLASICRKNIPITESADIPGIRGEIKNLLKCCGAVSDFDYKILNNKAIIKGNILFTALYEAEDMQTATISIPFTEVFEAEGLAPDNETKINIFVSDCDVVCDTDLSGEYKMLDISLILTADVISCKKEELSVIEDIFLPRGKLKTENCTVPHRAMCQTTEEEKFVKETLTISTSQTDIEKILSTDVCICPVNCEGNIINASALVTIVYQASDSSVNCHSVKIPISHKTGCSHIKTLSARVKHVGYVIASPTSVELRLSIDFSITCSNSEDITLYTLCEKCEYTPEKRSSVIVSCINEKCTLWDVAKKYNIPISTLAVANAINENDMLSSGCKLIIPR